MTAQGLIEFAKSKIGTPYIYGAKGTVMSLAQINSLRNRYGSNCVWWSDSNKAGQVCVDCSGLISWYTGIIRGSGQYKSTATDCIPISQRSNAHIGWACYMSGHIGIYLGDDMYIAADGSAHGVRIAKLSQNRFTHLIKLCDVDYGQGLQIVPLVPAQPSGGKYNALINFTYSVRTEDGTVYDEVVNNSDYAGQRNKKITDVAIRCDKGSLWYQVHILGRAPSDWLDAVTGCDWSDSNNGFAGDHKPIDAIRVYYNTPEDIARVHGYQKAQYRISPIGRAYYSWQFDNETKNGQDGYAGNFGTPMDRFQLF